MSNHVSFLDVLTAGFHKKKIKKNTTAARLTLSARKEEFWLHLYSKNEKPASQQLSMEHIQTNLK